MPYFNKSQNKRRKFFKFFRVNRNWSNHQKEGNIYSFLILTHLSDRRSQQVTLESLSWRNSKRVSYWVGRKRLVNFIIMNIVWGLLLLENMLILLVGLISQIAEFLIIFEGLEWRHVHVDMVIRAHVLGIHQVDWSNIIRRFEFLLFISIAESRFYFIKLNRGQLNLVTDHKHIFTLVMQFLLLGHRIKLLLLSIHPFKGLIRSNRFDFLHLIHTSLLEWRVTKVKRLKFGSRKIELRTNLSLILK